MLLNISKKTKIVCTIGPSTDTKKAILDLYKAGMNVIRINFSHGTHEEQLVKIKIARDLEKEGIYIPVALDTKGPEIRIGYLENKDGILIKAGHKFYISMKECLGTEKMISVTYPGLINDVKLGDSILIDDGNLELNVIEIDHKKKLIGVKELNTHLLKNQKGVNVPSATLSMPFISERDKDDIKFGCEQGVDLIFASFARRKEDVIALRKLCKRYGKNIPIIAKIENPEAVSKVEEIIKEADGVMVARGDLGVEIPPEEVPVVQDRIVKLCRRYGKPVITATQMLDSMVSHPRPTRAEVSDVATAINESSDCVMLSAETASGQYPVEAVKMQAAIARTQEKYLNYEELAREAYETSEKTNNDAIANSIANTALLIGAKLIVNFSETGKSTDRVSKARPCCPIIEITNRLSTVRHSAYMWGVYSYLIKTPMPDFIEEMEVLALMIARDLGIKEGEPILLAGGTPTGAGKTNFMRILNVNSIKDFE